MAVYSFGAVDPDLPSVAPKIAGVFPHGARRGTATEVELSGQNLYDANAIQFAGRGVTGQILSATDSKLKVRVTVEPNAEVGRRDFRLTTNRGVYVGVFDIGSLPEIVELEKNDDWRKPQVIPLPVLVNGIIDNEDWDHFRIEAKAGETLVVDVSATRHGSRLDADLAILDQRGEELAWVDDTTIFGDPHLEYKFAESGTYIVRVGSLGGGPNADYRLSIGHLPYVRRALPAGLGKNRSTVVTLSGVHLDQLDAVVLGDGAVRGEILEKHENQARVRFRVPAGLVSGTYKLHALHNGQEIALPTVMQVSNLSEVTPSAAPVSFKKPLDIEPSTIVNGVILNPREAHHFRFHARAGETFVFHPESMKLGYHLDPTVTLFDSDGQKLGYADDPGADERTDEYQLDGDLSHRFAKDGTYIVAIRDGMYRGGEQLLYRLTVERKAPDFIVELREPVKTLYQGQDSTIQVRVRRRADWTAPVNVWIEGLPDGVLAEKQVAAPKNSIVKDTCGVDREVDGTIVSLPIHVTQAKNGRSEFRIKAAGSMDGHNVEHTGIVRYENASAGYTYGAMEVQTAELTIVPPPKVLLSLTDKISVKPGADTPITISIRRFGDAKAGPLKLRSRGDGIKQVEVEVAEGAKSAKLPLSIDAGRDSASVAVQALTPEGQLLGESAPMIVTIKRDKEADR